MEYTLAYLERVALRALSAGENVLLKHFGNGQPSDFTYKKFKETLTKADLLSNAAILKILKSAAPEFDILSEEGAPRMRNECRWIVDPLDGTTNYAAHLPIWGISIALECQGKIVLGVISHPVLKTRYVARRGGGAWMKAVGKKMRKIRVSKTSTLKESLGLLCFGYHRNEEACLMKIEPRLSHASRSTRRLGAAVYETAWVASGRADYSVLIGIRPWDVAAGALLVREAGGRVLDLKGREWTIGEAGIVISAPKITRDVIRITRRA